MGRTALSPSWLLAAGALALLLATCDGAPRFSLSSAEVAAQDTQDQLRGSWLREYSERGVKVRRVLSLEARGAFHEAVRVEDAAGRVTEFAHEGTWLFDGTNLKRKYTLMDGKPPSRLNVPFATFEITFASRNSFTGVDHIHGHRIEYRRLGDAL
jgi:hypothetical protein